MLVCPHILQSLLGDAAARARASTAARAVAESLRGAARRTVDQLAAWDLWPVA